MTTSAEALCVRVLWGERRVATHLLQRGAQLSLNQVGEAVPQEKAPMKFDVTGLTFHEGIVGTLLRNGETSLSLGDAVSRGLAVEAQGAWNLELGRADIVRLGTGPVSVEAFRVRAPPKAANLWEPDWAFLNTLLLCVAVFAGFAIQASINEEAWGDDDSVSTDVTKLRRILVKPEAPPPLVPQKVADVKEPKKQPRVERSEGSPKPPHKPTRDTGGSISAKELAGRLFGGPGAAGVMGPGGLGKELEGAMGSVVALNSVGNGGWSFKGKGAGGPGDQTIQIGGIGRSKYSGPGGVGIGALCKDCKQKLGPPPIDTDTTVTCDGGACMDKELIRKVINSHRDQIRYCYEQALLSSPSLNGKVAVQFLVGGTGAVPTARVAQNTAGNQSLSDCLVSRVRTWNFPVGKGGAGYSVTYPFVFKRAGN
ncbi:MAG: AgmX/PglI C-terminal domain-containing protein [Archangium sp.]